jgi:predicted nuclease with TOPRIM domain
VDESLPPRHERLARELARLESCIEETAALVARLRREKSELEARLAASDQIRAEAARRVQALLDRVDGLG